MTVRTTRVEIIVDKSRKEALKSLAVSCQRMQNRLWQIWLCHHSNNDSANKLRLHFDAYRKWEQTKEGKKPDWPVLPLGAGSFEKSTKGGKKGKETFKPFLTQSHRDDSFYRILSAEFPDVHVRTRGLLTNAWQSRIGKREAANGNLPGWVSILFANESLPSFTRPQPIPFDKDNARLSVVDGEIKLQTRLERNEDDGKSFVDTFTLLLNKKKARNSRVVANKIVSGEYAWKGSNLMYDRGKWYALLAYEMPVRERVGLDANKTLFVRPGTKNPWRVKIGYEESWMFGGNGSHVEYARRAVIRERAQRKEHYRWAGSSQKGRGGHRARSVWTKLSSRWKDFSKRYNHEVTRQIVRLAVSRGCGRVVYFQPKDSQREGRYLSTAGNDGHSAMFWDYFQFGSLLASKCETEGIECGKKTKAPARGMRGVRKTD
ncbi:MAG: hypothetical protein IT422_04940 [Pirellulaceae bacterium]|nr:hypothetical protein [Pirellulaceae bacterium]